MGGFKKATCEYKRKIPSSNICKKDRHQQDHQTSLYVITLDAINFLRLTPGSSSFLFRNSTLFFERSELRLAETGTMTAPDYEIPKDVVPPGDQTGIYYIPISNVCETLNR